MDRLLVGLWRNIAACISILSYNYNYQIIIYYIFLYVRRWCMMINHRWKYRWDHTSITLRTPENWRSPKVLPLRTEGMEWHYGPIFTQVSVLKITMSLPSLQLVIAPLGHWAIRSLFQTICKCATNTKFCDQMWWKCTKVTRVEVSASHYLSLLECQQETQSTRAPSLKL